MGKTWVSEDKHLNGQMVLRHLLKFEPIHNGKTLKIYKECKELNNQSDGFYYYDPDKKEIAFLALNSNGNISIGNIKIEEIVIVKYGGTRVRFIRCR